MFVILAFHYGYFLVFKDSLLRIFWNALVIHCAWYYTDCSMWGNPDSGIQEIFACGIQTPEAQALESEYSSRNPEFHSRMESEIHVALTKNLKSSTWNPEFTAWNLEFKTVLDPLTRGDTVVENEKMKHKLCIRAKFRYSQSLSRFLQHEATRNHVSTPPGWDAADSMVGLPPTKCHYFIHLGEERQSEAKFPCLTKRCDSRD